jgi:hypothetical protein
VSQASCREPTGRRKRASIVARENGPGPRGTRKARPRAVFHVEHRVPFRDAPTPSTPRSHGDRVQSPGDDDQHANPSLLRVLCVSALNVIRVTLSVRPRDSSESAVSEQNQHPNPSLLRVLCVSALNVIGVILSVRPRDSSGSAVSEQNQPSNRPFLRVLCVSALDVIRVTPHVIRVTRASQRSPSRTNPPTGLSSASSASPRWT